MGSEKYSVSNGFDLFLKAHGGSTNARTDYDKVTVMMMMTMTMTMMMMMMMTMTMTMMMMMMIAMVMMTMVIVMIVVMINDGSDDDDDGDCNDDYYTSKQLVVILNLSVSPFIHSFPHQTGRHSIASKLPSMH